MIALVLIHEKMRRIKSFFYCIAFVRISISIEQREKLNDKKIYPNRNDLNKKAC